MAITSGSLKRPQDQWRMAFARFSGLALHHRLTYVGCHQTARRKSHCRQNHCPKLADARHTSHHMKRKLAHLVQRRGYAGETKSYPRLTDTNTQEVFPGACRILLTSRPWPQGTREYPPTYLQEYSVEGLDIMEG